MKQLAGQVPAKFYKYRAMTPDRVKHVEDIVVRNQIYFASPNSFNDPFDLKPAFSLDAPPQIQREYFLRLSRKHRPELSEAELCDAADEVMAYALHPENIAHTTANFQFLHDQEMTSVGVFCVSTKRDDILMWSHYADSHKGICLEFDGLAPAMAKARKVNYSLKRVPINPHFDDNDTSMEKTLLTKSKHWKYEAEWRFCRYSQGPGPANLPHQCLTGIILGALASHETFETVSAWVAQRQSPVAVYQATTSRQNFELLISPRK